MQNAVKRKQGTDKHVATRTKVRWVENVGEFFEQKTDVTQRNHNQIVIWRHGGKRRFKFPRKKDEFIVRQYQAQTLSERWSASLGVRCERFVQRNRMKPTTTRMSAKRPTNIVLLMRLYMSTVQMKTNVSTHCRSAQIYPSSQNTEFYTNSWSAPISDVTVLIIAVIVSQKI